MGEVQGEGQGLKGEYGVSRRKVVREKGDDRQGEDKGKEKETK